MTIFGLRIIFIGLDPVNVSGAAYYSKHVGGRRIPHDTWFFFVGGRRIPHNQNNPAFLRLNQILGEKYFPGRYSSNPSSGRIRFQWDAPADTGGDEISDLSYLITYDTNHDVNHAKEMPAEYRKGAARKKLNDITMVSIPLLRLWIGVFSKKIMQQKMIMLSVWFGLGKGELLAVALH